MEKLEIIEKLIYLLKLFQDISGEEEVEISKSTNPFDDLPGFDSYRAIEITIEIQQALNCDKISEDVFLKNPQKTIEGYATTIEKVLND